MVCGSCRKICETAAQKSNIVAFIVSEIIAFIRTDGPTDTTRSTRRLLIKNIYSLKGRNRFHLPVTYFYSRVTGIQMESISCSKNGLTLKLKKTETLK